MPLTTAPPLEKTITSIAVPSPSIIMPPPCLRERVRVRVPITVPSPLRERASLLTVPSPLRERASLLTVPSPLRERVSLLTVPSPLRERVRVRVPIAIPPS